MNESKGIEDDAEKEKEAGKEEEEGSEDEAKVEKVVETKVVQHEKRPLINCLLTIDVSEHNEHHGHI